MRAGQYADLEIPHDWLAATERLRPLRLRLKGRHSEPLAQAASALLAALPERERSFCWQYYGQGKTLEAIGQLHGNLSRERVRQLLARSATRAETLAFGTALGEGGAAPTLLDTRRLQYQALTQASSDELLGLCLGLHQAAAKRQRQSAWHGTRLTEGVWLLSAKAPPDARRLRELMRSPARFRSAGDIAAPLGLSTPEVEAMLLAEPSLRRTQGGFYGDLTWSRAELMEAAAHLLSGAGITQWHYSQLGKAAAVFDHRQATSARNLAALMARPGLQSVFMPAGSGGHWCLKKDGDGHRSNRDAVLAVLREAGRPLHVREVTRRLQRTVPEASLYALLQRDGEVRPLVGGVFVLATCTDDLAPFSIERSFLHTALGEHAFLSAQVVDRQAIKQGLDLDRLATAARVLPEFAYWKRGRGEALYTTAEEAQRRNRKANAE